MTRYKIDIWDGIRDLPFGVYKECERRKGLFRRSYKWWGIIRPFATREEAREFYEKIKDLPEYLGGK